MSAISLNYICLFLNYKIVCFEVLCIIVLSNAFSYQTDYWTFRSYPEKTRTSLRNSVVYFAIIKKDCGMIHLLYNINIIKIDVLASR